MRREPGRPGRKERFMKQHADQISAIREGKRLNDRREFVNCDNGADERIYGQGAEVGLGDERLEAGP